MAMYKSEAKKPRDVFFTAKDNAVYAITTNWPNKELVFDMPKPSADTAVTLLGRDGNLKWKYNNAKIYIDVSDISSANLPCDHAWVLKMTPM
jgi:alpha-L-fucosidase